LRSADFEDLQLVGHHNHLGLLGWVIARTVPVGVVMWRLAILAMARKVID
jgi:hypothetical protein